MDNNPHSVKYRLIGFGIGSVLCLSSALGFVKYIPYAGIAALSFVFIGSILDSHATQRKGNKSPSKIEKNLSPSFNSSFSYPESPETAVARQVPSRMVSLLKRESERKRYNEGLEIGAEVAKNYIRELSSEEYSKINKIEIIPEQSTRFLGIPVGRKALEVKIQK